MKATHISGAATTQELLEGHRRLFVERFGAGGVPRLFYAPGRVSLLGAHLDYNGGPVMPMAVDRGTFVALRPRSDSYLRFASTLEGGEAQVDLDGLPRTSSGHWSDYPIGVACHLVGRGAQAHGMDVLFGGNLPIGAGLSSSASISVASAYALGTVWGATTDPIACIEAALFAERTFVGVHCGIMDPYAVGLARRDALLWLDCKDASFEHLPLPSEKLTIAVADSGVRRTLAKGEFNRRVAECSAAFDALRAHHPGAECLRDVPLEVLEEHGPSLSPSVERRARHVLSEVARTFAAREALIVGDLDRFGGCLTEAHRSLRDLFEVSIPELDHLVASALEWEGALGARLTGAGFGGCVVCVLRTEARDGFVEHLARRFEERFGSRPPVEFFRGGSGPYEFVGS